MPKKIFGKDIGPWTELKLECIKSYLGAYSNILHYAGFKEYYFIDAFAGEGWCRRKRDKKLVHGSSLIALNINPPFTKYFFIELDSKKALGLEEVRKDYPALDIIIEEGDCNITIKSILKDIKANAPFIALLDPQAGDLYWNTVREISQKDKAEVLINFPFGMAVNRCMPLTVGSAITKDDETELDEIFGDKNWKEIYLERKSNKITPTIAREKYLDLYLSNLLSVGFKYIAVKNIKNSRGNHIYYLIFGTKNIRGLEKMKDVLVKNETGRNTLFFLQELKDQIYRFFNGNNNLTLNKILERLLSGKHLYRKQDFKDALRILEKDEMLQRKEERKNARSFHDEEVFKIV